MVSGRGGCINDKGRAGSKSVSFCKAGPLVTKGAVQDTFYRIFVSAQVQTLAMLNHQNNFGTLKPDLL